MKRIYTLFLLVSFSILFSSHLNAQGCYCTCGVQYGNLMGITNFQFNTINNGSVGGITPYTDYSASISTQIIPALTYNMSFTCNNYGQYMNAWIDYNHDCVFQSNEQIFTNGFGGTNAATYTSPSFTIPTTGILYGATRLRVRTGYYGYGTSIVSCGNIPYGETEDYTVNIIAMSNMRFDSTYAVQVSGPVFQGQNFAKILDVNVVTYGFLNRMVTKKVCFSTSGTTSTSDILKARLFKADKTPLSLSDAIGTPIVGPNGSFYFVVNDTLMPSQHYILTYDVNSNATPGNVLDAVFDSIIVRDTIRTPRVSNPTGNRSIVQYFSYTGYCNMGVNIPNSSNNTLMGVSKFYMTDPSGAVLFNNITADRDATTLYSTPNPTVYRQSRYGVQIKCGAGNNEQIVIWVDWNNDGAFDATTEEAIFHTPYTAATTYYDTITVPCTATTGNYHRMRVVSDYYGSAKPVPCSNIQYGDIEDYIIYIANDPIPSPTYARPSTSYTFSQTHFTNTTSTKGNIVYSWDFTNTGVFTQTAKNGVTSFTSPGKKIVTLKATVNSCDSTYFRIYKDTVTVVNPTRPPKTDFIASKNIVAVFDQVDINDLTEFGPSDWRWEVTPDYVNANQAYDFMNGTSPTTQNISLVFYEMGYYTVKLVTTNMIGDDSITKTNYIYVAESVDMCTYASSDKVAGFLYDDGNKGVYSTNHTLCTFLINPVCNTSITLKFSSFDVSMYQTPGGDWLKVYDGKDNKGTQLHTQAGYPNGFQNISGNIPILPPDLTAYSGNMYIEWHTDGAFQADGFAASWTAQLKNVPQPSARLSGPDTVYQKVPATFVNLSTGTELIIQWDTNNDGFYMEGKNDTTVTRFWDTTGVFKIGVMAQSCAKMDTFDHPVLVIRPKNKPTANFSADFRRVPINYPINLTDKSIQTGTLYKWKWTITPSTYKILNNKTVNDQNIKVSFNDTGYYSVKLVGTNAVGTDDTTMNNYIYAYQTCIPDVSNLTTDVGFSTVYFENSNHDTLISSTSPIGLAAYTDYSSKYISPVYQGAEYIITMKRSTIFNNISRTVWIDFNQDGDFNDKGEQVVNDLNAPNTTQTFSFKIPTNANTGFTPMRIAANAGILANKPCGPNYTGEFEDYGLFIQVDDIAPIITLKDPTTMTINSCATFVDPGYSAWDNADGTITSKVVVSGNVFNTKIGAVHTITYNVKDAKGNKAIEKIRTVIVQADTVKPVITLAGNNPDSLLVHSTYTGSGYTATDNCSGIKSKSVSGTVDINKLGTYNITYTATDSAGNIETKIRYVIVYDNILPTISKNGKDTIYVNVKTPYTDPGVTVNDNYWKNPVVTYSGSVNTSKVGTYILTYCVTDSSDNGPVCLDRYVVVQDKAAPVITLIGDTVILDVKRSFADPGYFVSDNYWSSNFIIVTKTGFVNINKIGDYILTYVAKDASGNVSPVLTRLVKVVDRIAPTINLLGQTIVSIPRWSTFEDPDVSVKDNYYTNAELVVNYNAHGTFTNTQLPGLYSYTYSVCDPSNNCSQEITRLIFVEDDPTLNINTGLVDNNIKYYPNPANNVLNIDITLPKQTPVKISIYNNLGEEVSKVFTGSITKSSFKVDVSSLSSGIYIIRFNINQNQTFNKKLIISK
jgi:PKD repeat protein